MPEPETQPLFEQANMSQYNGRNSGDDKRKL
jgi:hypothetical protein